MSINPISIIQVYYLKENNKLLVGRLALKNRKIFFEYDTAFLHTGIELSPFKLPLKNGVFTHQDSLFDGLFGVFNDSLPDGWGRLLLDRMLMQKGISSIQLSPLDRLAYVGSRGMGALAYEPEITEAENSHYKNLDEIAHEITQFQETQNDYVEDLLAMNGSSAGARPKIVLDLVKAQMASGDHPDYWIIKFRSALDPKDIGPIEYAYHLMAKAAGLDVPNARLFPAKKGPGFFGVKRFDRSDGKRIHMHTLSGLLHIDHHIPSMDYETIMKATSLLTKNIHESEKQFRNAVFNLLTHNRDDHAKNFSFLLQENNQWQVSPAYDLTFSSGPAGEHCTTFMGEGKNPTALHLLNLAKISGINITKATAIIDDITATIANWRQFAQDTGVSPASCAMIQKAFNQVAKNFK